MLSRQCELKIEQITLSLPKNEVEDLMGILDEVKELCIIDEDEFKLNYSSMVDFKFSLNNAVEPMKNEISIQKIIKVLSVLITKNCCKFRYKISPRANFIFLGI